MFLPKTVYKKKYKRRKKRNLNVQNLPDQSEVRIAEKPENFSLPVFEKTENNFNFQNFKKPVQKLSRIKEIKTARNVSFGEEVEREKKKMKWPKFFLDFSMALLVSFLIFFAVSFFNYMQTKKELAGKNIPENISSDSFIFDKNSGVVAGEEKVKGEEIPSQAASISSSENFKLKEISFGGVLVASANGENLPPEISEVKSEIFMTRDGKQAEILISWKTNKLATSEIEYSKSDVKIPKVLEEKNYGFNHSVVLTKLDLGTTYVYRIKSRDRWGNEISSERFGIYSGSKMVSVFDLIIKAADETFSWAIKK